MAPGYSMRSLRDMGMGSSSRCDRGAAAAELGAGVKAATPAAAALAKPLARPPARRGEPTAAVAAGGDRVRGAMVLVQVLILGAEREVLGPVVVPNAVDVVDVNVLVQRDAMAVECDQAVEHKPPGLVAMAEGDANVALLRQYAREPVTRRVALGPCRCRWTCGAP
jgi:hypothetical protein